MTTTLVTGANRGIGLEFVLQLWARGDRVIAVCRESSSELDDMGAKILTGIDVSQENAGQQLAERVDESIDILIANAGVLGHDSLDHLDFAKVQKQIEVNALGSLRTVHALLPRLHQGSKIALITSRMGSIADNSSGGFYGYRMSKAALNAAGMSLARDLKERGIAVALLHPGYVRTAMTGNEGGTEPSTAVNQLLQRIEALTLETSGTFWHASGEVLPW
jgi:NAD(P)-dependent dehydrogenase (short-subunit alcohol dehydrogenase family)